MELFATSCVWNGDSLTIYEPSQYVHGLKNGVAQQLDIDADKVRVINSHVGGAFGSKGSMTPRTAIIASIARRLGLSPYTVRKHLENAFARLDVTSRTAAVAKVCPDATWLDPPPAARLRPGAGNFGLCGTAPKKDSVNSWLAARRPGVSAIST